MSCRKFCWGNNAKQKFGSDNCALQKFGSGNYAMQKFGSGSYIMRKFGSGNYVMPKFGQRNYAMRKFGSGKYAMQKCCQVIVPCWNFVQENMLKLCSDNYAVQNLAHVTSWKKLVWLIVTCRNLVQYIRPWSCLASLQLQYIYCTMQWAIFI